MNQANHLLLVLRSAGPRLTGCLPPPDTNSCLVAPVVVIAVAINSQPELQRYKILFISGGISSWLNQNITELDVRRTNTLFQLMTILEENHHSFLIVEHGPLLYEDTQEMVACLAQALKQTSREATVLLYAPALDPHLQEKAELADRIRWRRSGLWVGTIQPCCRGLDR